jgi:hypothetical protein
MFTSIGSVIDERASEVVLQTEMQELGVRVVAASVHTIPLILFDLVLTIQKARKINVLEEFILKSAVELTPPPTLTELTQLLGIDRIFIDAVCQQLRQLQSVALDDREAIGLTEIGKRYYQSGEVPIEPEDRECRISFSPLTAGWQIDMGEKRANALNVPWLPGITQQRISEMLEKATGLLTLEQIQDSLLKSHLGWHAPKRGQQVVQFRTKLEPQVMWTQVVLSVAQDTLAKPESDNVSLRVHALSNGTPLGEIEKWLDDLIDRKVLGLVDFVPSQIQDDLWPANAKRDANEPLNMIDGIDEEARRIYQEQKRAQDETQNTSAATLIHKPFELELLFDADIRPRFLKVLSDAKHTVLIYSPWINSYVIDNAFLAKLQEMATRGVTVIIGWGIAQAIDGEDKPPSKDLLASLANIRRRDGAPGVVVWWVGNQHRKNVLADQQILLSGSHNFLSYRGDYRVRGEEAFLVTQDDIVNRSLGYMEPLFAKAVEKVWEKQRRNPNTEEMKRACVSWIAVRQAETALKKLLEFALNKADPEMVLELTKVIMNSFSYYPIQTVQTLHLFDLLANQFPGVLSYLETSLSTEQKQSIAVIFGNLLRKTHVADVEGAQRLIHEELPLWRSLGALAPEQSVDDFFKNLAERPAKQTDGQSSKPGKPKSAAVKTHKKSTR